MDERRTGGGRVLDRDTLALLDGRQADERRMGGESATAALMVGRQLDERKLAVLDGRESAGLGYGGFAGRMSSA